MTDHMSGLSSLPLNTFETIPEPRDGARRITALVRENGRVTGYVLSDGQTLNKHDGVELAKHGGILGVGVATRHGGEYLKSLPDADDGNNLGSLPSVPPVS